MTTIQRSLLITIASFSTGVIAAVVVMSWSHNPQVVVNPAPHPAVPPPPVEPPPPVTPTLVVPAANEPDWRSLESEIGEFKGTGDALDQLVRQRQVQFANNPAALTTIAFAALSWAEKNQVNVAARREAAIDQAHSILADSVLWEMGLWKYWGEVWKDEDKRMNLYQLRKIKQLFEENYGYLKSRKLASRTQLDKLCDFYYSSVRIIDEQPGQRPSYVIHNQRSSLVTKNRLMMDEDQLKLAEAIESIPDAVALQLFPPADAEAIRKGLKLLGEHMDAVSEGSFATLESMHQGFSNPGAAEIPLDDQVPARDPNQSDSEVRELLLDPSLKIGSTEELEKILNAPPPEPFDIEKANKEYRDLTADPPLPKAGEKKLPKPPEEKFVPYLKDPANKAPKAGGLGLSLEVLTDLTRAELGPLPFPLPLQLSGLEGARHPQPQPPGMMSDQAKTRVTYKARRALMSYLEKQAGRDIPTNYGKVDAPMIVYDSLTEYMEHKDDKKQCYFLIGRNLEHAQRLLLEDPIQIRRCGVGLAEKATIFLLGNMDDKPLAMAIMDLYVMPYLHLGHKRREDHLSKHHLLGTAMAVYSWSDFPDKMQLAAEEATRDAADPNGQDAGRYAIAKALVRQKKIDEAVTILGQITDRSLAGGAKAYAESLRKEYPGPVKP